MSKYPAEYSHLPEHLITNSMKQYLDTKVKYPDIILFWRTGDFYETFGSDAHIFSRECEVVLTRKAFTSEAATPTTYKPVKKAKKVAGGFNWDEIDGSEEEEVPEEETADEPETPNSTKHYIPMAGVPYHSIDKYVTRLIERGYKVAIAEQIGEPGKTKGPMDRQVRRVVTPGTVVEPEMLEAKRNNFLVALWLENNGRDAALAYTDISTGEFCCAVFNESTPEELQLQVRQELVRLGPSEVIIPKNVESRRFRPESLYEDENEQYQNYKQLVAPYGPAFSSPTLTPTEFYTWHEESCRRNLLEHFGLSSLEPFGCAHLPGAVRASGAILEYLKETQKGVAASLNPLRTYSTQNYMLLDMQTRRNLELIESRRSGSRRHSLFRVLDKTRTAMGGRLLYKWLNQPLLDVSRLQARQKAVTVLYESTALRDQLREVLNRVQDLERLSTRVAMGVIRPRELEALRDSLDLVPEIRLMLEGAPENVRNTLSSLLKRLYPCEEVCELLRRALAPSADLPAVLGHGTVFGEGYNPEFDEVRDAAKNDKEWVKNFEASERERSGIRNLKVGYNKVFGYYIEITTANLRQVPKDYIRKQTLTNGERYVTTELKEKENLILTAKERILDLEASLYKKVLDEVSNSADKILATASAIAHLDVFASLAEVAVQQNYVCPELNDSPIVNIKGGRHPVVEVANPEIVFVPNDLYLNNEQEQVMVITGPNMAGKSTIMRQAALIVLMAQIGSFVPADSATIGLVDRIFTRVGAQDDIATGQSTFMVEMVETSYILAHATPRSLIILDEVGRGTSTYDGMAIAQAIIEYIHNNPRCQAKTLFATHYHELVALADQLPRVRNYNVAVSEDNGTITFLRKLVPGGADRSYGIHVAQLAGLPSTVTQRAEELLAILEADNVAKPNNRAQKSAAREPSINLDAPTPVQSENPIVGELRRLRIEELSPVAAINKLYELQQKLREFEASNAPEPKASSVVSNYDVEM